MANLFANANGQSSVPGYVSNRFGGGIPGVQSMTQTQAFNTPLRRPKEDEHWLMTGAKTLAAAPVDVVDSMAALFPGMERGDVNDATWNAVGQPGFADWVRDNKGGVEVASGLLGAVAVGVAADIAFTKLVGSAWFAATGVGQVAGRITNSVAMAQRAAANATLDAAQLGKTLRWYQGANFSYVGVKAASNLARASVSELAIVTALNKNTAIWTEDMGLNLMFMGIGLGVGGVLGGVMARGQINRWANSDVVAGAFAEAADPRGFERMFAAVPTSGTPTTMVPKVSSEITNYMLNARNDDAIPGLPVAENRSAIQTQAEVVARRLLQTMTTKGISALPGSKFSSALDTAEGAHLVEALRDDPTTLFGAGSIGKIDPEVGAKTTIAQIELQITSWKASKNPKEIAKAAELEKQTPLVLVDKAWMTIDDALPHTKVKPSQIETRPTAAGLTELTWDSPHSAMKMIMREDGGINKPWHQLDIEDMHGVIEAGNQLMTRMLRRQQQMIVPAKPSFFQLDLAIEFETRGGQVNWAKGAGLSGIEEARIASLKLKYADSVAKPVLDSHARFKLNLPQANSVERMDDPNGTVLKQILFSATKPGVTTKQLADVRVAAQRVFSLTSDVKGIDALDGGMFGFNRSRESGRWLAPIVGMFDDVPAPQWSHFDLGFHIAENKLIRNSLLLGNQKAPLTATITHSVLAAVDEVKAAMDVSGLANSQVPGTSNIMATVASQFTSQAHRFRDVPALIAAQSIRRRVNRITELYNDEVFKRLSVYTDQFASTAGSHSRILFNQYMSNAAGWEIASTTVNPDGTIGFILKRDSVTNARRLGRPVKAGELLINERTGKNIVLDGLGNQARVAWEKEAKQLLAERNSVRMALGLEPIRKRDFYVHPAKADKNRIVGFTLDAANRAVPGKAVVATSDAEFKAMSEKLKKELKPGERFMKLDEIREFADLWEQAQMDWIDPTAMAAPAYQSKGTLASAFVNPHAYEDMLAYLKQGFEQNANGAVRSIFDAQLKIAGMRGTAEAVSSGIAKGTKNIWTIYEETLLGIPGTSNPVGAAAAMKQIEDSINKGLAAVFPRGVSTLHVADVVAKLGVNVGKVKDFNDLATKLGPYTPFKDAMDYADYTHGIKPPPEVKQIAQVLNRIGSGVILRWLEVPHAMMNMAGIITNMPAIVLARNVPMIGRVGGVPVVDSAKIMAKGMARMFRDAKINSQDWAMMVRNGDTSQDVAELHMQLSLLKGKSRFMRMVTGNPGVAKAPGISNLVQRKGFEGMASIIADTSENWSRQISHFIGLELADYHGIVGLEARHNFARKVANDAIANYDPLNRPEIYQSAFGSMYGLFLSYAQNYYQRLFRWMEAGDYKAVGINLAAQASMFGFMGLPGARALADLIGNEEDGDGLLDGIYKRFGPATGAVVANGGFNQLVTLFGLPPVALHTRGDANFRSPALSFATTGTIPLPIGLEVVKDITVGTFQAVGALVNPAIPNSGRYAAENLARNMPSRMLRGAISVMAADGQEADAYGNLMSENQNLAETVYRFLGLRSGRQQAHIEAYFMNQKAQAIDAQRMDGVRAATRALVRTGDFDKLPEVFNKYVEAGGQPHNYASWIRGIIKEASNTRSENQLLKSLRGPAHQDLARRIELFTGAY